MPWQEGLDPKAQTGSFKGLCELFKSDTKMSNSIILQRSCCGKWKPCTGLCSFALNTVEFSPFGNENQACVGALLSLLPLVWILSSTCRICCIFMWEESSTNNVMHLFHSLKQKTRISKFYTCFFNFIFEFAQLLHPSPQNIWGTFTGDPNSSSISCGDLIWFYSPKTGRIQKEIPIYWRCFLFQSFPYATFP